MKKCRALGPWFQRRLRTASTTLGVQWMEEERKTWVRVCGVVKGDSTRLVMAVGSEDSEAIIQINLKDG